MGRRIEYPQLPKGQPAEQLQALYNYLYQMAEALNNNLAEIGNGDFTDDEMVVVKEIVGETGTADGGMAEAETLKSLIIKTAKLIKSEIDAYNLKLIGTYEADGKLGKYVRNTRLDVDVTPTGIQQNYTFKEIIQGLKTYEVNAKNYIKTGILRYNSLIPVYGVAIGKDVVTFSEDGTETYNDGNKVAELTADELSFWQNSNKIASYTGTSITLYSGTTKRMVIDSTGTTIYDGSTKLAEFTGTALKFYHNGELRTQTDANGQTFYKGSTKLAELLSSALKFYQNGELREETDANGMTFWKGSTKLAELTGSELKFYHGGELRTQTDANGMTFYKGSTKLAELLNTALKFYYNGTLRTQMDTDGLKIYDGSTLLAKFEGNRIGFYYNGTEIFYILNGKIYSAQDMEISSGKKVKIQDWEFVDTGLEYTNNGYKFKIQNGDVVSDNSVKAAITYETDTNGGHISLNINKIDNSSYGKLTYETSQTSQTYLYSSGTKWAILGKRSNPYVGAFLQYIFGRDFTYNGQDASAIDFILDRNCDETSGQSIMQSIFMQLYSIQSDTGMNIHLTCSGAFYFERAIHGGNIYYDNLYQNSSREVKHKIKDMDSKGEKLDRLRPVTFAYNNDPSEKVRMGLIYEETKEIMPEICTGGETEKAINYTELIPILLKEIQELRARVKALEER